MRPDPHQIDGARFLAERTVAILADEPRVGKTGAAIAALDMALARSALIVTTASGRPVLRRGVETWQAIPRKIQTVGRRSTVDPAVDVVVVGWADVATERLHRQLQARQWDALILDESHYGKSFDAARTRAVYGVLEDGDLFDGRALVNSAARTWCLTGTPLPVSPMDLFPFLRSRVPDRVSAWPDEAAFRNQFCEWYMKRLSRFNSTPVVKGGKNLDQFRALIDGLLLRRTQADVGILTPVFEMTPLEVTARQRAEVEAAAGDTALVMRAIDEDRLRDLEMHMGPVRRLCGMLKVDGVVQLVRDEFGGGLDKIVLAYWHRDVGDALAGALAGFGVARVDGSTPQGRRESEVAAFSHPDGPRVFLAQAQAAAEAIDLSAAAELLFVEMSFVPKDGAQMALRVTNRNQSRRPRVRVAFMEGSIDEPITALLLRRTRDIERILRK